MMKRVQNIWAYILVILFSFSCGSSETPDLTFFLSKEWKMTGAFVNGEEQDEDLANYRLKLNEDLTFTRTGLNGVEDSGTWILGNGDNQLELTSNELGLEEYLIVELQFRLLELQVIQGSNKVGATEFRYILEPIRP